MLRLRPEDLQNNGKFLLLDELHHINVVPFVAEYFRLSHPPRHVYRLCCLFATLLLMFLLFRETVTFWSKLWQTLGGFWATLLFLLPLHETIHALAYRFFGADDVRVIYCWRRFTAYAVADNFVLRDREFFWVSILPFLSITLLLVGLMGLCPAFRILFAGMLLLHTAACNGDFALLNYRWMHRHAEMLTYDDLALQRSYFYLSLPASAGHESPVK
jgi:hypothetical protein